MYEGLRCDCANTHSLVVLFLFGWAAGGGGWGRRVRLLGAEHGVMDDLCLSWIN